ncbi:hypothetical protein IT412_05390 [Candidatus Peregrinibacteria bacterium]|nr:hypothetical protein [Candidatus Peregrinibacteria bacterium]
MEDVLRDMPPVVEKTPLAPAILEVFSDLEEVGIDTRILEAAADLTARERLTKEIMRRHEEANSVVVADQANDIRVKIATKSLPAPEDIFVTPELPKVSKNGKFLGYIGGSSAATELMRNGKIAGVPIGQLSIDMFDLDFTPRIPGVTNAANFSEFKNPGMTTLSPVEAAHYGRLASCTFYLAPHIPHFSQLLNQLHAFATRHDLKADQHEWLLANFYHNLTVKYLSLINKLSSKTNVDDLDRFVNANSLNTLSLETRDTDLVIALLFAQNALVEFDKSTALAAEMDRLENLFGAFLGEQFGEKP